MKSVTAMAAVALAAAVVLIWPSTGHSATSARWTKAADLNVEGIKLGMAREDALALAHHDSLASMRDIRYDEANRVRFVSGLRLSQGAQPLATYTDSYTVTLKTLGAPLAGGLDARGETQTRYYQAGSSYVIFRYDEPSPYRRTAALSQFALAKDADSIPSGWDKEILDKALH